MKIFLFIHFAALILMCLYGLYRLILIYLWKTEKGLAHGQVEYHSGPRYEPVTIQLPIYNERFVAGRLIDSVCQIRWPKESLEIQVLDDSNEYTCSIVDARVSEWRKKGINIQVLRRKTRNGYKAGALACGLKRATGEFIAIFDADFLPPRDFLERTMPYFQDKEVGLIQARWEFLNEETSWFTRLQGVFLSAHFGIEQFLRFRKGLFLNFNGTAGVWRREAIVSSGGWQADTVTEDLDMSFRAQIKGWKAVYLNDLEVPSELPITLTALRSQQRRWAKGSVQTARKILPSLWTSRARLAQKIEGTILLLSNLGWLMGALIFITLYPTLIQRSGIGPYQIIRIDLPIFLMATWTVFYYFYFHERHGRGRRPLEIARSLWLLAAFGLGLAPSVSAGILEGLFSHGGEFVRTPKFGITGNQTWKRLWGYHRASYFSLFVDLGLLMYSLLPVAFAIERGTYLAVPFLAVFTLGFLLMLYLDVFDLLNHSSVPPSKFLAGPRSKTS